MDVIIRLDHALFSILNQSISNPLFDWLMPFITNQDNWIVPIVLVIAALIWKGGRRGRFALAVLLAAFIITDVICAQIIKPFFGRLRPSHADLEGIRLLVGAGGQFGFVSNHAANSFCAAMVFGNFYNKTFAPLMITASVVAFSRVYVGVHYPADIVAGSFVGIVFGFIAVKAFSAMPWGVSLEIESSHEAS